MTKRLTTEIRKEQIIKVSLDLLADRGVKGISMGGISSRLGLVPSAIYRHYTGRGQIIDAVLDHIDVVLQGTIASARAEASDGLERLRVLHGKHVTLIKENGGISRVSFSEEVYGGTPARRERLRKILHGFVAGIVGIVSEGQSDGSIRKGLNPTTVAVLFIGLIQPAAFLWHISKGDFDLDGHSARGWQMFVSLLKP
jgi:TetR/AcrR family fatty acid metabolism transcriptional regulator